MDPDEFSLRVEQDGQGPVARITGDLDFASTPALRQLLQAHTGQTLTLDFSGVRFMDSVTIGLLVSAHTRAERDGGRIVLQDVPPAQMRLFELTGVTRHLHFEHTAEA